LGRRDQRVSRSPGRRRPDTIGPVIDGFVTKLFDTRFIKDAGNGGDDPGLPTFIAGERRAYGLRASISLGRARRSPESGQPIRHRRREAGTACILSHPAVRHRADVDRETAQRAYPVAIDLAQQPARNKEYRP